MRKRRNPKPNQKKQHNRLSHRRREFFKTTVVIIVILMAGSMILASYYRRATAPEPKKISAVGKLLEARDQAIGSIPTAFKLLRIDS